MGKRRFIVLILFILAISFSLSAEIENILHLNIQVVNSSNDIQTGTFSFVFNISTSSDCSNVVYTNSTTLTTDSRGTISYYLTNVNLNFSEQYWLCYYRNGVLINASKIARVPYAFRAKNVTLSGVDVDTNLMLGIYNITAGIGNFGAGLSLSGYRLNVIGNVNVTGNLTLGIGTIAYNQSAGSYIYYNGTAWYPFGTGSLGGGSGNFSGSLYVYNNTDWIGYYAGLNTSLYGAMSWRNTSNMLELYTKSYLYPVLINNLLFVNGSNVGIGTINPSNTLDVRGQGNFSGTIYINNKTSLLPPACAGTEKLTFDGTTFSCQADAGLTGNYFNQQLNTTESPTFNNGIFTGYVGIGTASPIALLTVSGAGSGLANEVTAYFNQTTANTHSAIDINALPNQDSLLGLSQNNSRGWDLRYDAGTRQFQIRNQTGNQEFLVITKAGNVGIGTTSPAYLLEIANSAMALNVSGLFYANSSNIWTTKPITVGNGMVPKAWNQFGSGAKGQATVNDTNDVYISGTLEVDGGAYLTGGSTSSGIYWTGADIAENLQTKATRANNFCNGNVTCYKESTEDDIDYGDLVCMNKTVNQTIMKCNEKNSRNAVGFVSKTFALNVGKAQGYPVALAGLVPAHTTNENGNINPGDLLISASRPGYAMKKGDLTGGMIVGLAYDFCDKKDCEITVFVTLGISDYVAKEEFERLKGENKEMKEEIDKMREEINSLKLIVCEDHPTEKICQ